MDDRKTSLTHEDALAGREQEPLFSLVLGGAMYNLFLRAHLSGNFLEHVRRRMLVIVGIAWLPLLVLSIFAGDALRGTVPMPFLLDIEVHVKFLIALPLMFAAERIVHDRLVPLTRQFVERRLVVGEDVARFNQAIVSTNRLRNSVLAEVLLLIFVYTVGLWVWRHQYASGDTSWYADASGGRYQIKPAGYWYLIVSLPLFQFVLLRWYYRLFLWFFFLYRVSRLDLRIATTHPDRTGGLGFLGNSANAFTPFLVAQGVILASLIASQIFFAGRNLMSFKVEVIGFVTFFVIIMLLPLTVFTPKLAQAKRSGSKIFGQLGGRYANKFEEKWFRGGKEYDGELLGSRTCSPWLTWATAIRW